MTKEHHSGAPKIGEVYAMKFEGHGSAQQGWRPGIVFQNNVGNMYSPNLIAIPLTSSIKRLDMPTHVFVPASCGLPRDSMALCENVCCMPKDSVGTYITTLPDDIMSNIAVANLMASASISYLNLNQLVSAWQQASKLNQVA